MMRTTQDIAHSAYALSDQDWQALEENDGDKRFKAEAYRLAFSDPEFLLRRETRGIRFQLELMKPELDLRAAGIQHTVVVYGSARIPAPEVAQKGLEAARRAGDAAALRAAEKAVHHARYYAHAREFGRLVARHGKTQAASERLYVCTGGGPGIMEAANRGAHDEGERSVGLNIVLPHEQSTNAYVTPELAFKFHYFALRKMHFMMRASAFVAFPGGYGTLDELFEVLTLIQTKKVEPVPVVLFGADYWERLLSMDVLLDMETISAVDLDLFHVVDDVQEAWRYITQCLDRANP